MNGRFIMCVIKMEIDNDKLDEEDMYQEITCCWENCNKSFERHSIYNRIKWIHGEGRSIKSWYNYRGPTKCLSYTCSNVYCPKHSVYFEQYCYECFLKKKWYKADIPDVQKYVNNMRDDFHIIKKENDELKNEIVQLKLQLKYQPGGEGAKEAQKHFEELVDKK